MTSKQMQKMIQKIKEYSVVQEPLGAISALNGEPIMYKSEKYMAVTHRKLQVLFLINHQEKKIIDVELLGEDITVPEKIAEATLRLLRRMYKKQRR